MTQTPIAIIGMGCLFPGAQELREFWRNIRTGKDSIVSVPETHWAVEDYFDADPSSPDKTYCKRGGFLSPYPFDPIEFGIPPTALEATDTAQLLGLVVARMALEDAGYGPTRTFDRDRVSVVLGVTGTQELVIPLGARLGHPIWRKALRDSGVPEAKANEVVERISAAYVPWQENSFPGLLGNVVAGRIANRLDLGGTNCVVDAACASSLSAAHLAALELQSGRTDMVVTGGVDALNDIFMFMCFSKTPALSPTGDARPFDESADGTILGEGIGMVVLKRLDLAERDGDRIYAVIRGIGTSSDGKAKSIYAPRSEGQAKALRSAYSEAGVSPATVELVEAHGTGTKVGDATEVEALKTVYRDARARGTWCALGSVKSQIGHTKAAAGAAGLIKAALALHNKVLPPTLKVAKPNPKLGLEDNPFYISAEARPWAPSKDHPRRSAVSSFGFGGSNFHVVLEEHGKKTEPSWDGSVEILALSAASKNELSALLSDWEAAAKKGLAGKALANKAALSRKAFSREHARRLVLVLERETLEGQLGRARAALEKNPDTTWDLPEGVYHGTGAAPGKLAFVFPGQGSQYVGMGRDLACVFPGPLEVLGQADAIALEEGADARISERIFPHPVFDDAARKALEAALTSTETAQPALACTSLSLLSVLESMGVSPDATAGHSFGELVALCAAGRIDTTTLHRLARLRGRLMKGDGSDRGTMLAVSAPLETVERLIAGEKLEVVLANRNAPSQAVLSGSREAIARAAKACQARGLRSRELAVAAAFHSPLVASAAEPFRRALEDVAFGPGRIPVYANATAAPYPESAKESRDLLGSQIARPVDWTGEVERLHEDGVRTFVEVGPKTVLSGLVRTTLGKREHRTIALDASQGSRSGVFDLARALAELAALGHEVRLERWENDAAATADPPAKPRMTIPLVGANYRSPAKPQATEKREAKKVEHVRTEVTKVPAGGNGEGRKNGHTPPATPRATFAAAAQAALPARPASPPPASEQPRPIPAPTSPLVLEAFRASQESLRQLQALQEQTATLHRRFLEGQEAARATFETLVTNQQRLVEKTLGLTGSALQVPAAPAGQRPTATAFLGDTAAPAGQRAAAAAFAPPTDRRPDAAAFEEEKPARDAAAGEPTPVATNGNLEHVLLDVVAEKTGYPRETLALDMDLESDLGIDSIKRVEILSGVQERAPDAPTVDPEHLGRLRTLRQIVEFIASRTKTAPAGKNGTAKHAPAPTAPAAASATPEKLERVLLDVVSEKTGYPRETLALDMDLESDLGIDSIKRVEILSGVQERAPDAPSVDPEHLGRLRTLRQIVDFIASRAKTTPSGKNGTAKHVASPAPATASSAPGASPEKLERVLLDVVSEKTGYPRETLALDMDLESDLGIDSIKRVEILSGVQERAPDAPSVDPEHLGRLRTLRQIVDFIASRSHGSGSRPAKAQEPASAARDRDPIERRVLVSRELPRATGKKIRIAPGHEILVTDDGSSLSKTIVEKLAAQGLPARTVELGERVRGPVGGLVVLAPAREIEGAAWPEQSEAFLKSAFMLVKDCASDLRAAGRKGGAFLATVSRLDGAFGLAKEAWEAPAADPTQGGLAGLAKTAAREWPEVGSRALDLSRSFRETDAAANAIVQELGEAGPIEVGLAPDRRLGLEPALAPLGAAREPLVQRGDVVIVTGGARGVTAETTAALARSLPATYVLLGRSPEPELEPDWLRRLEDEGTIKRAIAERANGSRPSPREIGETYRKLAANREVSRNLERIAKSAKVVYRSVDARDGAALRRVLDEVRSTIGPIRGLVHGAGVVEDRKIEEKTREQLDRVLDTKIASLRALLEATEKDDLRLLAIFSSASGRYGRRGQSDYAIANEALNKIAQREAHRRPGARVVALGFGPWSGGMVSPALAREFAKEGVSLIPLEQGGETTAAEILAPRSAGVEVLLGGSLGPTAPATPPPASEPARAATTNVQLETAFERVLDVERHPFLASHVLGGRPVLPLAMTMEWLAHGALHGSPGLVFAGFDDLRVLKALALDAGSRAIRVLAGAPTRKDGFFSVPVELRSGENVHARATAVLASSLPRGGSFEIPADLASRPYPRSVASAYEEKLFHGPHLHAIDEVLGLSEKGIAARAHAAPAPRAWISDPLRTAWIADPLAIDAGFQLAILWCQEERGASSLPARLARYRQFAAFPKDGVQVTLEVERATPHSVAGEIVFAARDGSVVARISGYECTVDANLSAAFRRNGTSKQSGELSASAAHEG